MNIITNGITHPSQEGIQVLIIFSTKNGHHREILEMFNMQTLLKLCKNEGEQDRIRDFPIIIHEMGANKIISLGTEGTTGDNLIGRLENRLYLMTHRTNLTSAVKQFLNNSICIIAEYNDINSTENAETIKVMFTDFIKSTPK